MVQLSNPYMAIGKSIALTIQTFVSKVMSLLFHTLSRFVIAFFPRNSIFLISWLQSFGIINPEMDSLYLKSFFLVKKIDMESSIIAM